MTHRHVIGDDIACCCVHQTWNDIQFYFLCTHACTNIIYTQTKYKRTSRSPAKRDRKVLAISVTCKGHFLSCKQRVIKTVNNDKSKKGKAHTTKENSSCDSNNTERTKSCDIVSNSGLDDEMGKCDLDKCAAHRYEKVFAESGSRAIALSKHVIASSMFNDCK